VGLTTLPPSCDDCLKIWELQPPGTLRACNGIALSYVDLEGARCDTVGRGTWVPTMKIAGSIPDGVTRIIHYHNPSGRTMTLGSIQPLTKMNTRNISWGKGGRCLGLTTFPHLCDNCLKIWEPQPPGTLRACQGL
jgi:hypothetical protein